MVLCATLWCWVQQRNSWWLRGENLDGMTCDGDLHD
jgi:hypothetical protein